MKVKVIKTEAEYEAALARIEELMDAEPGSVEEEELELLALLVEKYEDEHYPIDLPDPVEAIKFRMEQEGLAPKDMVKYLGSQSKVSEVLNYKRPLSLTMIRALHEGLGIPTEVLVQEPPPMREELPEAYGQIPFNEMYKRGYFESFQGTLREAKAQAGGLLDELFAVLGGDAPQVIYCRRGDRPVDEAALKAWQARALHLALREDLPPFSREVLTEGFIRQVARLSFLSQGPRLAKEMLNKAGIHLVILPHLPQTYLDGACFYAPDDRPVVALTLRHDRLDNFWFTLVHELAHLYLHLDEDRVAFFDNTEQPGEEAASPQEKEANDLTNALLIPPEVWEQRADEMNQAPSEEPLLGLAREITVSPAIVAGRVRYETGDYTRYNHLVGSHQVREQFSEY